MIGGSARILAAGIVVLGISACESGPVEPPATTRDVGFSIDADGNVQLRNHSAELHVPPLPQLFRRAIEAVALQEGRAAAVELLAPVRALQAELRQAREAGDREAFLLLQQQLRSEQASIIVTVFGDRPAIHALRTVQKALQQLDALVREAEAAGIDVRFIRRRVAVVAEIFRDGRRALADGDGDTALDLGTRAAEILGLTRPPNR